MGPLRNKLAGILWAVRPLRPQWVSVKTRMRWFSLSHFYCDYDTECMYNRQDLWPLFHSCLAVFLLQRLVLIFSFFIYIRLFILSASRNKFKPVCQKVIVWADPVLHLKPTFHVKPTSHVKPMFAPHTKLVFEVKFHATTKKTSLSCSRNLSCQRHGTCHVTRVF